MPEPGSTGEGVGNGGGTSAGATARPRSTKPKSRYPGRQDWSTWPHYERAAAGFRGYWYPVAFANHIAGRPTRVRLLGEDIMLIRDAGTVYALENRCPHRGVPLSYGNQQFPGTVSCVYHGWTFDLQTGRLCAVITDGPESPICGKVTQPTYPVAERLGLVWVFVGDAGEQPHPLDEQLPEELVANPGVVGVRLQQRAGNWRFACENGYDEGHAKYLHRTSLWRLFKPMPVWNRTRIVQRGRWIYRVQEEQHWEADFPGLGRWSSLAWYKKKPSRTVSNIGNTGADGKTDRVIAAQDFPGFASVAMPGVLRIAYPNFIHYEFYVPTDAENHLYVGMMVNFGAGRRTALRFALKYLGAIRWLFHGQFSAQDKWMVEVTDAPPERLYRPDDSLLKWRKLANETAASRAEATAAGVEATGADGSTEATAGAER